LEEQHAHAGFCWCCCWWRGDEDGAAAAAAAAAAAVRVPAVDRGVQRADVPSFYSCIGIALPHLALLPSSFSSSSLQL